MKERHSIQLSLALLNRTSLYTKSCTNARITTLYLFTSVLHIFSWLNAAWIESNYEAPATWLVTNYLRIWVSHLLMGSKWGSNENVSLCCSEKTVMSTGTSPLWTGGVVTCLASFFRSRRLFLCMAWNEKQMNEVLFISIYTVQPKRNARTKFSFNQFGMKFWPNLHVNWMQLNLQIGYN